MASKIPLYADMWPRSKHRELLIQQVIAAFQPEVKTADEIECYALQVYIQRSSKGSWEYGLVDWDKWSEKPSAWKWPLRVEALRGIKQKTLQRNLQLLRNSK